MIKLKLVIKGIILNLIFTIILFICAGRLNYIQGWIFLFVMIITTLLNLFYNKNEELLNERSKPGEGVKRWDKILLGLSAIVYLIIIITAGFDSGRFHPNQQFNIYLSIVGIILLIGGQLIFLTARSQNSFFSSVARIQTDRGHVVCDTGLYSVVRHPGYLGMMLSLIALPFIFVSVWSIYPMAIAVILLFIRTVSEDKMLKDELDGYWAYTKKTRYKIIPFIW